MHCENKEFVDTLAFSCAALTLKHTYSNIFHSLFEVGKLCRSPLINVHFPIKNLDNET